MSTPNGLSAIVWLDRTGGDDRFIRIFDYDPSGSWLFGPTGAGNICVKNFERLYGRFPIGSTQVCCVTIEPLEEV